MALILTIDTAMELGSVAIVQNNIILGKYENNSQKDHAAFVQTAIDDLVKQTKISLQSLDAIAVVNGPGSYTGLRVGLATAKGLCYALDKKLILLNTLDIMAAASIHHFQEADYYFAPMIDARREDVFMGIYNHKKELIQAQAAETLSPDSFKNWINNKKIVVNGSGAAKAATIVQDDRIIVWNESYSVEDILLLAQEFYNKQEFSDIAYSEPNYLKAFYTTAKI